MSEMYGDVIRIRYTSEGFPAGRLVGLPPLETSWDNLLHAALTVGRPNIQYVFRHGRASLFEAVFRFSLMRMALEQRPFSDRLHRTEVFKSLDPTEKGAVSYFLGMALCKLFAYELLHTPWLIHVDALRGLLPMGVLEGRSRPDLVGKDRTGNWLAFECKGRSSVPRDLDLAKAKKQADRLVRVDAEPCDLHIGAITYFRADKLEFRWRDPDPEEPERLDPFEVRLPDDVWRYHYEPALALASETDDDRAPTFRGGADVDVHIHDTVLGFLRDGAWTAAHSAAIEIGSAELRQVGYQDDGIRVTAGASWRRPLDTLGLDQRR